MRTEIEIRNEYNRWITNAFASSYLMEELRSMDDAAIEDAFYRDLAFGTGGLRGVIGAGTNRMNIFTVAKASQGLADYLRIHYPEGASIAVSYDSRIKSDVFSRVASSVFAANGIKVFLYDTLMPTPCLSYAVRKLGCAAGVMITASHNPSKYNGYKVYGADGCQITTEAAKEILAEIQKLDIFKSVKSMSFQTAVDEGLVSYIDSEVYTAFTEEVKAQSVLYGDDIDKNVAIVFTPLNGTGLKPVMRALTESGFNNITVVAEQEQPDGNFPTCPKPNPEIREAMELGLQYCERYGADLLLATDPDCDRCGIAVKSSDGYQLLTANEVGLLMLDYICSQRAKHGKMPAHPIFAKTIVTIDLAEKIASHYGVETINVLTGFKFIGEVIGRLEAEGRESDYICGFEESYGYLTGTYVRDKDGVNAAYMICEMFAYYKTRGISLLDKLQEIYSTYGYCLNTLHSYDFEGSAGMMKMKNIMEEMRKSVVGLKSQTNDGVDVLDSIAGLKIMNVEDYSVGLNGLPKSNVLKIKLDGGSSVVVRPSGTEPKIKVYVSVIAGDKSEAMEIEKKVAREIEMRMG